MSQGRPSSATPPGYVPVEQLGALLRLLYPDHMDPIAKRQIESVIEQHAPEPVDAPAPDDPEGYSLVYPFVVCASNGGPYDDKAFVAGVRFGRIDSALAAGVEHLAYVEPALAPQLDLLAMHHGFSLSVEPWEEHPDEWALARFVRGGQDRPSS